MRPTRQTSALRRRDRGSVLLIAVILVVVAMGLAGAYLVVAGVQSKRVVGEMGRGRAQAAAEDGIDHMRVYLLSIVDSAGADPTMSWDSVLSTNGGTPSWATDVQTPEGGYTVRVADNDDGDGDFTIDSDDTVVLESRGHVETGGEESDSHVIRCIVHLEVHDPTAAFAILTGGDLLLTGDEVVDGTLGGVHTNEDLTLQGRASVSESASASATTTVVGDATQVGGDLLADRPIVAIAPVVPADYRADADYILTSDGRMLDGATGMVLFDFSARAPGGPAPAYQGFLWGARSGWSTATSGWVDGMYYVEGNIRFEHGGTDTDPWVVTLVAEGSIQMHGNPYLRPYYNSTELFVAGADVFAVGTGTNAEIEGEILAHEQVCLDGNITFAGRIVAESAENTPGSLNGRATNPLLSIIGGNVHVTYDGNMSRSLVTDFRLPVLSWQEELHTNVDGAAATGGVSAR